MKPNQWRKFTVAAFAMALGLLSFVTLLTTIPLLPATPSLVKAAGIAPSNRAVGVSLTDSLHPHSSNIAPTLQLLAFQPSDGEYLFTARLSNGLPHTQYVISAYHHTDIDYLQKVATVTTNSAGVASAKIGSRCTVEGTLTGTVFARLAQADVFQAESNHLGCPDLQTIGDFGSYLGGDSANNDWIYRPSPPGSDDIYLWIRNAAGRAGLTGTISIQSAKAGYQLPAQPLLDEGDGLYSYVWSIAGRPRADDYRAQLTLGDGAGGLSGLDAFAKLSGRAAWVWGEAKEAENPMIWAILTNEDNDGNGVGDRDEWLAFSDKPYGLPDPYVTTSYLSVFPYLGFTGTLVTDTFQTFLTVAHATGEIRVEALAGTHQWVETDSGLQDGKNLCAAILEFNRAGATPAGRFDGIHFDVEHDDWFTNNRWARFIELITYCQTQVDSYNQTHEPVVFGVDIPPHFKTGPKNSGEITSGWDILTIVDYISLMDYRDFADVRWDGRTDGIIVRAEPFIADGNALGKSVMIGVELTPNPFDHVTFFEECPAHLENELRAVSQHFALDGSYKGVAIHSYEAWSGKEDCDIFLPMILKSSQ